MLVWLLGAATAAVAAAGCVRASRLAAERGARAWRMQSLAALAWAAYGLLQGFGAPDLVATGAWCVFAVLVGRGMWLTSRGADVRSRTRMLLDAVTAGASALVVLWTLAAGPAWAAGGHDPSEVGLVLRPVVAVGLGALYGLVLLAEFRPGLRLMPGLLIASMAAAAVAEAAWSWTSTAGSTVASTQAGGGAGVVPAVGLVVGAGFLIAASSVYRGTTTRLARPPTTNRVIAMAPFAMLVPVGLVLLSQGLQGGHLDLVQGWGVALLVLLVLVRQGVTGAENRDLVHRLWLSEDRLRHQATHDPLTGLPNRALLSARLDAAVASPHPHGLVVLDLDGFKAVNDRWGHAAGDLLLVQAAERLRAVVREDDLPVRLGGDEFAVVVADDQAAAVAERVLHAMAAPFEVSGRLVDGVSASIGVAGTWAPGSTRTAPPLAAGELLHRADTAMYVAKHRGGGVVVLAGDRSTSPETWPSPLGVRVTPPDRRAGRGSLVP